MKRMMRLVVAGIAVGVAAAACSESGAGGREINITQTDDGCAPTTISVDGGEKLQFVVANESGHDVYEVEGIEGTRLEEFIVPSGKTRKAGFTVPGGDGTYKLKCYVPSGPETVIDLVATSRDADPGDD